MGRHLLEKAAAVAVASVGWIGVAQAQDIQGFKPAVGTWNYLSVNGGTVAPKGQFVPSLYLSYGRNPLVERDARGSVKDQVIENLTTIDAMLAVGIHERIEIGLDIPFSYTSGIEPAYQSRIQIDPGGGLGDIRLLPKFIAYGTEATGFGVALAIPTSFPTGDEGNSSRNFVMTPTAILEFRHEKFRVAVNGGFRWRPTNKALEPLTVGNGITYGAAAGVQLGTPQVEGIAEVFGTSFSDVAENEGGPNPLEGLLGLRFMGDIGLALTLGGGIGIVPDYGSPEFRVLGGLSWMSQDERVVVSGMEGQMATGDRDGDGVRDGMDACLDEKEDRDGFEDADGCPDTDNDRDAIADVNDACPMQAEDIDGFEDKDGCPDTDNDKDGIVDMVDRCPMEPETKNGDRDEDGCPDTSLIVVQEGQIRILQKVFFETAKAVIKPESFEVLNQVAEALHHNQGIEKIRVEGHTDTRGNDTYNQKLSEERAASVALYLIGRGIDHGRIDSVGYGEARPLSNDTGTIGMAMNRRVEFRILSRSAETPDTVIDSASTPAESSLAAPAAAQVLSAVNPGTLDDTGIESSAEAVKFSMTANGIVPAAEVELLLDSNGESLIMRLGGVKTTRRWVKLEDAQVRRALVHPSKERAPGAILRVRFKKPMPRAVFDAIRVTADAPTVVFEVPRTAEIAAAWSGAPAPVMAPEPVEPEPIAPEPIAPEPVVAEPEPAAPEPVVAEPEPFEPAPVEPAPVAEPEPFEPAPIEPPAAVEAPSDSGLDALEADDEGGVLGGAGFGAAAAAKAKAEAEAAEAAAKAEAEAAAAAEAEAAAKAQAEAEAAAAKAEAEAAAKAEAEAAAAKAKAEAEAAEAAAKAEAEAAAAKAEAEAAEAAAKAEAEAAAAKAQAEAEAAAAEAAAQAEAEAAAAQAEAEAAAKAGAAMVVDPFAETADEVKAAEDTAAAAEAARKAEEEAAAAAAAEAEAAAKAEAERAKALADPFYEPSDDDNEPVIEPSP